MGNRATLAQLGPIEQLRAGKLMRRLVQLMVGLTFFGISMALMIRGNLGLSPWDSLHVGLAKLLPVSFGWIVVGVSFLVLLLWIPLREIPGIGTIANAVVIGVVADISLRLLAAPDAFVWRLLFTIGGVLLCGLGSALYIGAQLGRGPRDGLMTGLNRVTGYSLRSMRTAIELSVLLVGFLLAGSTVLGVGTLLFALGIGPLTQLMLPWVMITLETAG
ncbi:MULTISPECIES: membrane protein [Pseudomonas]|uniref:Membrane protein n=2 Tax=Pseudomonadaceae TaxID=135621 RepID=A0A0D0KRD0_9PSED|nr:MULTISPECIES: membrane protein [Pseudomonas]KIP99487.1 membrane protein [Pseudomonas fulva]MCW2295236.1 putative membrane protein YczE [Pseudomonas sp. BIGb0408]NYH75490.1 putative membrane protein YczE [Pseudomonas flavescens]